jgi:hypothetical protein
MTLRKPRFDALGKTPFIFIPCHMSSSAGSAHSSAHGSAHGSAGLHQHQLSLYRASMPLNIHHFTFALYKHDTPSYSESHRMCLNSIMDSVTESIIFIIGKTLECSWCSTNLDKGLRDLGREPFAKSCPKNMGSATYRLVTY